MKCWRQQTVVKHEEFVVKKFLKNQQFVAVAQHFMHRKFDAWCHEALPNQTTIFRWV